MAVIDELEIVEVAEQHRNARAGTTRPGGSHLHAVEEQRPVGQSRERVVVGLVLELRLAVTQSLLRLLPPGDVLNHTDKGRWPPLGIVHHRNGKLPPEDRSVFADIPFVDGIAGDFASNKA